MFHVLTTVNLLYPTVYLKTRQSFLMGSVAEAGRH